MRPGWILVAALLVGPAVAGDCPPPKPLTCEQLLTKAEQRHCFPKTETATPTVAVPCTHPPCPPPLITVNCPECKPVTVEKFTVIEKEPVSRGNWFAGAGPLYSAGWGAEAAVGYRWANGWMFMAGPTYVPHDSYNSAATNCRNTGGGGPGSHGCPCVTLPYSVDSRSAWGGTALLLYNFK